MKSGFKLDIKVDNSLPNGISYADLDWSPIDMPISNALGPRDLGYNYDTWDEYYEAHPDDKPEYCDCCGNRI